MGMLAKTVPLARVTSVLEELGRASQRKRELPAHVMVYYVIAMALYMSVSTREVLRCLLEGVSWLFGPHVSPRIACKSGISQARTRLGWEPMARLHDELVTPIATPKTKGAWYRGLQLVTLDGSTLAVPDTQVNREAFGKPGASRGEAGFPKVRFVSLVEAGTHVLFGSVLGPYAESEISLAHQVIGRLKEGMLCLADRNLYSFELWTKAKATGAHLCWRVKINMRLPVEKRLADGSYLSTLYPSEKDRRHRTNGCVVRVIEYWLEGIADAEPIYRLITTILDPDQAPASELASLYHERWEIENTLDEFKTHLRGGAMVVLRSKTPNLVRQEFFSMMLAHFAIRGLMHEAALGADLDPDRLSYTHAIRVVRRRLPLLAALPPWQVQAVP
jgi:hypothetical protein